MAGDGVELIVGVRHDASFGLVTVVGMGGVLVEVMKDVAMRVGTVGHDQALTMLRSLTGAPLLAGVRGRPPLAIAAAADAIARLSSYAAHHGAVVDTLEINPLLVRTGDVVALDILLQPREPSRDP